jgi:hypothetical protein
MSEEQILALLRTAVVDDVIYCLYCEYPNLEPDYDRCPECHKKNPLKEMGLI